MAMNIAIVLLGVLNVCILSSSQQITFAEFDQFVYDSGNVAIKLVKTQENVIFTVDKFGHTIHRVHLKKDFGINIQKEDIKDGFILHGLNQAIEFKIAEDTSDFSLMQVSTILLTNQTDSHCVDLETGQMHWFGGPEMFYQYWPVEKLRLEDYSYVPKEVDHVGVAERYWLNSRGGFIYVDDKVPLFVDQNVDNNKLCLKAEKKLPYNVRATKIKLSYHLGAGKDAREVHLMAVERFLKKPTGLVDRLMVEHPLWSTWARYKRDVNESSVETYVSEIEKYGFKNSQFEIDDDWEKCYGALEFRPSKFPNIKKQTDGLRARGFRVTLWIHPFINKGCEPWYSEAKEKGYFVVNHEGNPDTQWWNSKKDEAAYIDFTKPEAAEWFVNRLKKLQEEAGIDSYKFDAGETSWVTDPKLNTDESDHPLAITKAYIRTVSKFGPIVEVRSAYQTQDLPIFTRFIDKDSYWDFKNGLATVITTLLQMNMVGYVFILPDMVGGGQVLGEDVQRPSEELFVRWLQANVFMPSIQYSYVPWEYSQKTIEICKYYTELHAKYTDDIMKAFQAAIDRGEPVNPPIWWLDPKDNVALDINDEFLLGDRILAAPVIHQGQVTRHVYLPKGKWFDPNLNKTYTGPNWLNDYPAPIDVLPYFIRQD